MPLFGLQCVIVVFPDHTQLLLLLLVKLYTRQADRKTWCSCPMKKDTLLEYSQSMELMMRLKNSFLTNVSKNGYVYFPDNIDIEWRIQFPCDDIALLKAILCRHFFTLQCTEIMSW